MADPEGDDDEPAIIPSQVPSKRKVDTEPTLKKTSACPGTSMMTTDPKKPHNTVIDKFSDIAKAEETLAQRQLDLKKAHVEADKEMQVVKINAAAKIRVSKYEAWRQLKMEQLALEKQKALMEHEFRMAQLNGNCGE